MAKTKKEPAKLSNGITVRQARFGMLLFFGLCAGVVTNVLMQSKPQGEAPQATGISTNLPKATGLHPEQLAVGLCLDNLKTLDACTAIQAKYPRLSQKMITAIPQFVEYYRQDLSAQDRQKMAAAILTLFLIESGGDAFGTSDYSTALGPAHTLVPTYAEAMVKKASLVARLKNHFPKGSTLVDDMIKSIVAYHDTEDDLRAIIDNKKSPAEARLQATKDLVDIKYKLRDELLAKFPDVVVASHILYAMDKYKLAFFFNGQSYTDHLLGDTNGENLRLLMGNKIEHKPTGQIRLFLSSINRVSKVKKYQEIDLSKRVAGQTYPGIDRRFLLQARSNLSIFFTEEKRTEVIPGKTVGKKVTPPTTVVKRVLIPRTAAEVQTEILNRWLAHRAHAERLYGLVTEIKPRTDMDLRPLPPTVTFAMGEAKPAVLTR